MPNRRHPNENARNESRGPPAIDRTLIDTLRPILYVPGCPPHPLTVIAGILDLLGVQ